MVKLTDQMKIWSGEFGKEYTDRNVLTLAKLEESYLKKYGITRSEMNNKFLRGLKISNILEVGSNVGLQLLALQQMGYKNLYGIEVQSYAVEEAKKLTSGINIIQGSAFDIPYKDNYFDLVFTSGVLIHISPDEIGFVMDEIHRCANRYIWGFEYYSDVLTKVDYRGNKNLLWKTDFAKLYLERFPDLVRVKEEKVKYLYDDNVDSMFLLEKK